MCSVDACVACLPDEHRAAIAVIYRAGMDEAMVAEVVATLRELSCELDAALAAVPDVTAVFEAVAAAESG